MAYITKIQKGIIMDIEFKLGIMFEHPRGLCTGRKEATKFIADHIEELRQYNKDNDIDAPPSGNQMRYIRAIEKQLNIDFNGYTVGEADMFIQYYSGQFELRKRNIFI